jgi:hypothetical protein
MSRLAAGICGKSATRRALRLALAKIEVGAAGPRALLLLQPDFFLGDVGELIERRQPAAAGVERRRQGRVVGHGRPQVFFLRTIIAPSDKPVIMWRRPVQNDTARRGREPALSA